MSEKREKTDSKQKETNTQMRLACKKIKSGGKMAREERISLPLMG